MTTKIPVELSSTPGIVDGSNATAITINSSEQVGIGTSSPARALEINSGSSPIIESVASGSNNSSLRLRGSLSAAHYWDVQHVHSDNDLSFGWSGSEKVRITDAGIVGIGTNTPAIASGSAGLVIHSTTGGTGSTGASRLRFTNTTTGQASTDGVELSLDGNTSDFYIENREGEDIIFWSGQERGRWRNGGGLCFNGDTAAANALDDYEEGTWTPVFGGNISATGQSYSVQEGSYTKIGRQVTCRFKVELSAEGTFENVYILLQGFPFALASSPGTTHLCNMYFTTLGSNYISLGLQGHEGNAQAFIWAKTTASDNREYLGKTDLTNTSQLTGTFTYFV